MPHDQQTYKRAATAAMVGLGIQFVLGVAMALLGLWSKGLALHAATWHLFAGIPIWFVLFLLYHQHKIERVQALEAEQLVRRDQQAAAIFEEYADDLDLSRRRLDRLYKWGLGVVSFVVAVYLIAVGGTLLYANNQAWEAGRLLQSALRGDISTLVLMFLTAAIAFVAFITGRYVSGMTRIKEWQLLRGGASYLMSSFVLALLLAVAAGVDYGLGNRTPLAALALIVPVFMILIGVEILLTFLLSAYRPRKPGEVARPAFDSRVLGLLTAPESLASIINETINYQFGFEISKSWFYRLLSKAVAPLIVFGAVILLLLSCLVIVGPHERAIITVNGKLASTPVVGPGLHVKLPWPFGAAERHAVARIHQIHAGSVVTKHDSNVAILWTNQHAEGEEEYMVTAPTPTERRRSGAEEDAGAGVGLLPADVIVQYRIVDTPEGLIRYATASEDPQKALTNIASRQVSEYFASRNIDDLLSAGRMNAGTELHKRIQRAVDRFDGDGLGLEIVFVGLAGIHPPTSSEVSDSFHQVINAIQERETTIQTARADAIKTLASAAGSIDQAERINVAIRDMEDMRFEVEDAQKKGGDTAAIEARIAARNLEIREMMQQARGEIARVLDEAMAYRWERSITERATAERFQSELLAYQQAPAYYRLRLYMETLATGMANRRKTIVAADNTQTPVFRFDFKDPESALDALLTEDR